MTPRVSTKSPGSIQSLQLAALDFVPLLKPVAPSFRPRWKYLRPTWHTWTIPQLQFVHVILRVLSAISSSIFYFSLPISSEEKKLKIRPSPPFFNLRPPCFRGWSSNFVTATVLANYRGGEIHQFLD